ncbi:MAG: hypothetical protein VX190_00345 [Bacteroidota bacterium]|nr:hypothetical protein [Bacteroidota bacterium]
MKRLFFKHAWLVLFLLTSSSWGWAQSGSLVVSGTLKHEETKDRLDNVTVSVLRGGEAFDEIEVDRNGKYFLDLPLRHDYMLVFSAEGLVAKRVAINSANTPEGELPDGFMFDLDMSLFDMMEGFDESIMETPIGIASFVDRSGRIQFDLDHTNDMRRRIDDELDRLADLADDLERAQMRYDNAMEDGERAEARSRWEDARDEYEKALKFKPGDATAQSGLDRANAELDAIRQSEEAEVAAAEAAAAAAEVAAAAEEEARRAEEQASRDAAERAAEEAQAAAEAAQAAEAAEAERRAAEEAERQAAEAAAVAQEAQNEQAEADRRASEEEAAASERQAQRAADAEARQAQLDADAAAVQAALDADREARESRQREWEAEQAAREAAKKERRAQAKARAQSVSQRPGQAEDEAEAYYRQALVSERLAMAAEVEDVKDDASMRTARWSAEAEDRARDARREALALDDGRRGSKGRDVQGPYAGKEEEHRAMRAANLAEIAARKASHEALQAGSAARLKNQGQEAMLDADIMVEASKERRLPLSLSPEDRDIPQGVQETSYDIQNGLVIMRTVRSGDVVKRYRKVVMKTGTYYFCGDRSITEIRWDLETNLSYD